MTIKEGQNDKQQSKTLYRKLKTEQHELHHTYRMEMRMELLEHISGT